MELFSGTLGSIGLVVLVELVTASDDIQKSVGQSFAQIMKP
ncbi:MAG: hypothetical protein Q3M30_05250 [Candidatus Electrothrix sp. Rat3]|jgi:hypothetical protein|nr:hypothetical protein [Candidatus Electrothrix rattekaaiensis]